MGEGISHDDLKKNLRILMNFCELFKKFKYSKIPILRPFLGLSKSGLKDHFWTVPKVVLKTTFGQSQRWSLIRDTPCVENEETSNLNLANKVFN